MVMNATSVVRELSRPIARFSVCEVKLDRSSLIR
jgi:hypothetical protein